MSIKINKLKYNCIFFEESMGELFPGFRKSDRLNNLPLWGNFTVEGIQDLSYMDSVPQSRISIKNSTDISIVGTLVSRQDTGDTLIIGRTGNVTVLDWRFFHDIGSINENIVKIHVGNVPSDLYLIRKKQFPSILAEIGERMEMGEGSFCHLLFDEYLFHHFDRIISIEGQSFLMRNSYEYYRENINLPVYLRDDEFIALYKKLVSPFSAKIVVSEKGCVINSVLGYGSRIHGRVENSIIFHDVEVGRGALVRDSVVLPFNRIEDNTEIQNALVLEGKDRVIEGGSIIGGHSDVQNSEFPGILRAGLSVIGHGISIPRNSRIGAACLLYGRSEKKNTTPLIIEHGQCWVAN
jgi:hypothetical protein